MCFDGNFKIFRFTFRKRGNTAVNIFFPCTYHSYDFHFSQVLGCEQAAGARLCQKIAIELQYISHIYHHSKILSLFDR